VNTAHRCNRVRGFSLVEVMVALIVVCVGLLGIAKMQALSLSNMTTSRQRSLAAFEAAGLAGAMHSNRAYWAATPANYAIIVNPVAAQPVSAVLDPALTAAATADYLGGPGAANGAPGLNACVGSAAGLVECTPVNLAAYDMARWTASLAGLLPNPTATISCPNNVVGNFPSNCTIQISWTEKAVSMNQQEAAQAPVASQFATPTYLLYVEP
jgi:type IV pilus assembly protein PilV